MTAPELPALDALLAPLAVPAAEHLRNALMLLDSCEKLRNWIDRSAVPGFTRGSGEIEQLRNDEFAARQGELEHELTAVRRRVAAALALLEGK